MAKGKASRHARKMASCDKCAAQAAKILQGRPRKARTPRAKNPYSTNRRRFIGPMAPGTVVIPKAPRTVKRTMTDEEIAMAGANMATKMSARNKLLSAIRSRRVRKGIRRSNSIGY